MSTMQVGENNSSSEQEKEDDGRETPHDVPPPLSQARDVLLMILITLSQLVQTIPFGAGINTGLAIGKDLGATPVQSAWIVASYPLTQGSFVLIGEPP